MKENILMILFVIVLGSILTLSLVAINDYTAPLVARNKEIKTKRSILNSFEIAYTDENIDTVYDTEITPEEGDGFIYFKSKDGNTAFPFEGPGLWGDILGFIAFYPDMKTIYGVNIMQQEETPGLGSRIGEDEYLKRFTGMVFNPELVLVPEGRRSGDNEIDAITGATMSCEAFVLLLNKQYSSSVQSVRGN